MQRIKCGLRNVNKTQNKKRKRKQNSETDTEKQENTVTEKTDFHAYERH